MKKLTVELYEQIYKDVIRDVDDYADKSKVRKHNNAHTKIAKLIKEIQDDKEYLEKLFQELLSNEDEKIRLSIAVKCIELNILKEDALKCLNKLYISDNLSGVDKLGIEMTLERYKK